jgi:elongation factor Ts
MLRAKKRQSREAGEGRIAAYIHHSGKIGALVELVCETDFVAKTREFDKLAREIAMQVASMNPKDIKQLLSQEYIRDSSKNIGDLVTELAGKTGEKIEVKKIRRLEIGE